MAHFRPLKSAAAWLEARKLSVTSPGIPGHVHWLQTTSMQDPAPMACFEYDDIASVSVRCWQEGLPKAWYLLSGYLWVLRYLLVEYTAIGAHVARIEAVC